jgi:SAM-dependent methyltransferase
MSGDPHDRAFFEQMRGCRGNYRKLAECIHQIVGQQPSCLDVGCGIGLQTARLMELGWSVIGAEHSEVARQMREPGVTMIHSDLTKAPDATKYACVICTETAEHIPEQFAEAIVSNVAQHATDVIVWSAAVPGQEWEGHINLQPPSYWLEKFERRGWVVDLSRTWALRDLMIGTRAQHWAAAGNFHVLVPKKKHKPLHFTVTSTTLNAEAHVARCIASVQHQTYPHWHHHVIDAKSEDETAKVATRQAKNFWRPAATIVTRNKLRRSALQNVYEVWRELPDDEVIVWLDGDDWLAGDRAFEVLARAYASPREPWMTYGQFMQPNGEVSSADAYPPGCDVRRERWRGTHLKTFRAGLVKQIDPKDLLRPDGTWIELAIDRPVMYPLLEMAGPERSLFIPNVLYVYNIAASWWANQPASEHQKELAEVERIRTLPAYPRLTTRPW